LAVENVIGKEKPGKTFLEYALFPGFGLERFVSVEVVSTLLDFRAKPGGPWNGALNYLRQELVHRSDHRGYLLRRWTDIIKRLIEAGVDINDDAKSVLEEVFSTDAQLWSEMQSFLTKRRKSKLSRLAEKTQCPQQ
jgi:hypothetical protein